MNPVHDFTDTSSARYAFSSDEQGYVAHSTFVSREWEPLNAGARTNELRESLVQCDDRRRRVETITKKRKKRREGRRGEKGSTVPKDEI